MSLLRVQNVSRHFGRLVALSPARLTGRGEQAWPGSAFQRFLFNVGANNGRTGQNLPVGHAAMSPLRFLLSSLIPSVAIDTRSRRTESCPPLARPRYRGWQSRLSGQAGDVLAAARLDFADALDDIRSTASLDAKTRIAVTRSLHELWHLREEVFSLVSRRHDQSEATRRLARLNRHFLRRGSDAHRPFGRP